MTNSTTTTFPSDDEWEEIERTIRRRIRLAIMARRLAIFGALTASLFMLLYWCFCIHHIGEGRTNHWTEAIEAYRRDAGAEPR